MKNVIYTVAATQSSVFLTTLIISSLLGLLLGQVIGPISKGLSNLFSSLKLERTAKAVFGDKNENLDKPFNIPQKINSAEEIHTKSINQIIKKGKRIGFETIRILVLMIIFYFSVILLVLRPANIYSKFERDITMIYPYTSEGNIHQLRSDWVCMRSEADYIAIYKFINEVKTENNLPK